MTRWLSIVAGAALLAACSVTPNPVVPDAENITAPIEQAAGVGGQVRLQQAMRAAQAHMAESGDLSGFTAATAHAYDPSVVYNTSGSAVVDEVSIRVVSPTAVVLVTKDQTGAVACMTYDATTQATTTGATDASTVEDCA